LKNLIRSQARADFIARTEVGSLVQNTLDAPLAGALHHLWDECRLRKPMLKRQWICFLSSLLAHLNLGIFHGTNTHPADHHCWLNLQPLRPQQQKNRCKIWVQLQQNLQACVEFQA
jgi:hypothetical protein